MRERNGCRLTDGNRLTVIYSLALDGEPLDWIEPTESERRIYEQVQEIAARGLIPELPFSL